MRLAAEQITVLQRTTGLYIIQACGTCGNVLNQTFCYCLKAGDDQRWCSRECQDQAMGWDRAHSQKAGTEKATQPAFVMPVCQRCQKRFRARRRDAQYCSARCRQWDRRKRLREREGVTTNPVVTDNRSSPSPEAHK